MKYLIILIAFFQVSFSSEIEDKFNFKEKAYFIDYVGCVIANNNIICYGTNSSYVISSDEGRTWKQGRIGNVGTIVKLEYVDNMILGFSLDGHSIKSIDKGKTWQTKQLNFIDSIYNVHFDSGYFFARCYNSLKVIDKDFILKAEYTDTMLTWSYRIYDVNNTQRNNIVIVGNNIYYDNISNKLYSINKFDLINNKPKLDSVIICDTCKHNIENMVALGTKVYFLISKNYQTNNSAIDQYEYNTVTKKTRLFPKPDYKINTSKYYNFDNSTYQVYVNSDFYFNTYFSINLNKYNYLGDSLDYISDSKNYPTYIHKINDLKLFKDSILIAVSVKNTIMFSRNLGKDWEVISTINKPSYIDCIYEQDSFKIFADGYKVFNSLDDGITFKCNSLDLSNKNLKALGSLQKRYIDSTGKIIMIYSVMSDPDKNVLISNDFGNSYELKNQTLLNYSGGDYNYFNKVEDKFINIINYNPNYREMNKNYFHYSKYTENMDYITNQSDSNNYIHSAVFKNETTGFLISTLNDSLGGRIEILQRNESKRKWERKTTQKINIPLTTIGTYSLKVNEIGTSKDSIVIIYQYQLFTSDTTFTSVFLYDNKFEKFETIYQTSEINSKPNIFLDFGNKFIIAGLNFFMESSNRSNLLDWKKYTIKDNSNWSWAKASADEKYYLVNYSSPTIPASTYKLTLKSNTSIEKTEDQTNFISYPLYPNPAKNELTIEFKGDNPPKEIQIVDEKGNLVLQTDFKEKINVSNLSRGVCFVKIDNQIQKFIKE